MVVAPAMARPATRIQVAQLGAPGLKRAALPACSRATSAARARTGALFPSTTDLERGTLVHVLRDSPPSSMPVSLLYSRSRQLSPRERVFVDWLVRVFGPSSGPR